MTAGILVNLDEAGVDDLETIIAVPFGMAGEKRGEDALFRPTQMKAVNAVPLSEAGWKLVPLAAGDENPPDPVESFSKIGGFAALFENVRSRVG